MLHRQLCIKTRQVLHVHTVKAQADSPFTLLYQNIISGIDPCKVSLIRRPSRKPADNINRGTAEKLSPVVLKKRGPPSAATRLADRSTRGRPRNGGRLKLLKQRAAIPTTTPITTGSRELACLKGYLILATRLRLLLLGLAEGGQGRTGLEAAALGLHNFGAT